MYTWIYFSFPRVNFCADDLISQRDCSWMTGHSMNLYEWPSLTISMEDYQQNEWVRKSFQICFFSFPYSNDIADKFVTLFFVQRLVFVTLIQKKELFHHLVKAASERNAKYKNFSFMKLLLFAYFLFFSRKFIFLV